MHRFLNVANADIIYKLNSTNGKREIPLALAYKVIGMPIKVNNSDAHKVKLLMREFIKVMSIDRFRFNIRIANETGI